jgi:transcriptional regulator with GAF, ATPase, and Fis domain/tetratricopeptide (TPR) repeat protein
VWRFAPYRLRVQRSGLYSDAALLNAALQSPWVVEPAGRAPRAAGPSLRGSGLAEVDAIARDGASRGVVFVQGARSILEAIGHHVERRARALGRNVVMIDGLTTDDPWRELASRCGAAATTDPQSAASTILTASDVVVILEGARTCWGDALVDDLARREGVAPLLFVLGAEGAFGGTDARIIEASAAASSDEIRLFWDAIARDADRQIPAGLTRLDALEGWWGAARSTPIDRRATPSPIGDAARRLLARLFLSQRSWPVAEVLRFGSTEARDELFASAHLDESGARVAVRSPSTSLAWDATDAHAVAEALDSSTDPWAAARASELWILAGNADRAEASAVRALGTFVDPSARADFWRRWEASLLALPAAESAPRFLRCAELALRAGDLDRACDFATRPTPLGDEFESLLTRGRVYIAKGDVTTGEFALGLALERAPDAAHRARAAVEMAEVRLLAGDLAGASRFAESGLADAGELGTKLQARNVIGKLLLADAAYDAAEIHFARDACEASLLGDLMAELRARLNRAIALLSSGRLHEARGMLTAVLDEGEKRGEVRAVAFALSNLATIATLQRDYVEALRLSERVLVVRRRIGDKLSLALLITNLAYLRLRIGQVAEAEQALRFGRQACGPGMPASRAAHFALVAARIHLARGNTLEAMTELNAAVAGARSSRDGNKLSECYRVEARIALENGDLGRLAEAIARAREEAASSPAHAEIALLEAMRARAAGEPYTVLAREALELARAAEDTEFATEAHLLLHHAADGCGDARASRLHLEGALALRNRIAADLPEEMRRSFFARREIRELCVLEAAAERRAEAMRAENDAGPVSADSPRATLRSGLLTSVLGREASSNGGAALPGARRIVGRDPAILSLLNAVQKVGPSDATVLIRGESGTGKELVAEAIHEASARRHGPLVKVNCAALVETLLLSELFGHEKGSFTGASARKRGRFEMAEGGTLFLDEIGDISPTTQVALLRVLQEKTFERVGGVSPIHANVRIICATHRDLKALVARGEFREDLYYRLRGVVLEVPSLRSRLGDLPAICAAILGRIATERGTATLRLAPSALDGLGRHAWPGNIRELENALRAAALFAEGEAIELEDFTSNVEGLRGIEPPAPIAVSPPPSFSGTMDACELPAVPRASVNEHPAEGIPAAGASSPTDVAYAHVRGGVSLSDMKRQIERDCIARALAESGGNITRAAGLLGMKRPRLSQLVKQYGFGVDAFGADAESEEIES